MHKQSIPGWFSPPTQLRYDARTPHTHTHIHTSHSFKSTFPVEEFVNYTVLQISFNPEYTKSISLQKQLELTARLGSFSFNIDKKSFFF